MTIRKPKPPTAGAQLVAQIVAEMEEDGLAPDARERALLTTAARLADRIEQLEEIVDREGLLVTSPSGVMKAHPAAVESRACSVALPRVLAGIATSPLDRWVALTLCAPRESTRRRRDSLSP